MQVAFFWFLISEVPDRAPRMGSAEFLLCSFREMHFPSQG